MSGAGLLLHYDGVAWNPVRTDTSEQINDVWAVGSSVLLVGTFGYQAGVLGRRRYLEGVPRTLDRLRRLLPRSPSTARIAAELDAAGLLGLPWRTGRSSLVGARSPPRVM